MSLPMYIECVVGYRTWKMDDSGKLAARILPSNWEIDKPTEARCLAKFFASPSAFFAQPHSCPDPGCTCGLHAWRTEADFHKAYIRSDKSISGAVIAWGKIEVHRHGFKAQFARPIALTLYGERELPPQRELTAQRIAENYHLPLLSPEDLGDYSRTFGCEIL